MGILLFDILVPCIVTCDHYSGDPYIAAVKRSAWSLSAVGCWTILSLHGRQIRPSIEVPQAPPQNGVASFLSWTTFRDSGHPCGGGCFPWISIATSRPSFKQRSAPCRKCPSAVFSLFNQSNVKPRDLVALEITSSEASAKQPHKLSGAPLKSVAAWGWGQPLFLLRRVYLCDFDASRLWKTSTW